MNIREIDHITIPVSNVAKSERFYHETFDMPILTDSPLPGVRAGKQRIYFRTVDTTLEPKPAQSVRGNIAFSIVAKDNLDNIVNHLKSYFVPIVSEPAPHQGTHGTVTSLMISDPDGNLVEIAVY